MSIEHVYQKDFNPPLGSRWDFVIKTLGLITSKRPDNDLRIIHYNTGVDFEISYNGECEGTLAVIAVPTYYDETNELDEFSIEYCGAYAGDSRYCSDWPNFWRVLNWELDNRM